jgi:putative transcriptional regulator
MEKSDSAIFTEELKAVADRISGDIVFSENPGKAMRKWRLLFNATQTEVARRTGVTPSVVSDYEGGRRTPGVQFVRRFISALLEIDSDRGYEVISKFRNLVGVDSGAIVDIVEYKRGVGCDEFCSVIEGTPLNDFGRSVYGHTVIDSIKAILYMNAYDFYRLYGFTSERAMIFIGVTTGRSPMVAVRVSNLKPAAVVLHGIMPAKVDMIAKKIAEIERIPLLVTSLSVDEIVKRLRRNFA